MTPRCRSCGSICQTGGGGHSLITRSEPTRQGTQRLKSDPRCFVEFRSTYQRHCQWLIERCYCPLKDFRRIATRYDKLAKNFFSSVCLVAAVVYWM